jgi:hypothetical protein
MLEVTLRHVVILQTGLWRRNRLGARNARFVAEFPLFVAPYFAAASTYLRLTTGFCSNQIRRGQ